MEFTPEKLAMGEDAWRQAKLYRLKQAPLDTPDKLGIFALLTHDAFTEYSLCLHFLNQRKQWVRTEQIVFGRTVSAEICSKQIEQLVARFGAASILLSFSRNHAAEGQIQADVDHLSRIALYCQRHGILVEEAILVADGGYIPLYRYFSTHDVTG